ncbi:polar amino acid ABC transporter, inner membrane subunit [Ancylobacter novellus DSM 506]|uniref:Polar amino acid ABC transporter, inner membrane subunit n=1 Tax=Ancylobacter novellus (strain ATCC 8093 / DSM 506 / JCM 20403 / CCM 1077 / IAM 12100 / NBRC 12443 / NCIMB 10456) TaxID=639283 RepID=D7A655_ANCN5|nr:ABC transporter permease [Ancylobacter novellus]ADH88205.1 polar amino acid ABC transporter, inner membrane subunit [Ancylobacter novellus DSM 506]
MQAVLDALGAGFLSLMGFIGLNADLMDRYGLRFLDGVWVTLKLVGLSVFLGALLSLPLAIARVEGGKFLSRLSFGYSYFFRGTPLLAQTFLVYYGAGQFREQLTDIGLWWFFRDAFNCAVFTFTLNTAAYQSEILRGGIQSLPAGQMEAAQSLGLSRFLAYRKVILPQAIAIGLRPLGNELILMIKSSAIASVITVYDLMGVTRLAFSRSYDMEVYLWAAVLYLVMVEIVRRVWDVLERRLNRHLMVSR